MNKRELFKVEGDKIIRLRRHCPKCGDGVFLAEHKNRFSCGTCGYTEFKGGGKKIPEKPVKEQEKSKEEIVEKTPVGKPVQKPETNIELPPEQQGVDETEPQPETPPIEEPSKSEEHPPAEEIVKTEEERQEGKPVEKKKEKSESKETSH